MHHRLEPKNHRFHYNIFMFSLDLDELPEISKKIKIIGYNRFNLFEFRDTDHLQFNGDRDKQGSLKEKLKKYLEDNGISLGNGRVMLVTHLRTLGYIFNPVSFYYCYKENDDPLCVVVEICNTFREMKLFLLTEAHLKNDKFSLNTVKHFYVSPFMPLDTYFDFRLHLPTDKLNIKIDDHKEDRKFFISTLTGKKKILNNTRLLVYFLNFPLITFQVIFLIHWQAFKLWMKRIPFYRKAENMHLQKGIINPSS